MAGTLRLSNTGTGNGQSTITTAASGDTTYTLPSGGGTFVTTASTEALTVPFAPGSASAPSVTFINDTNTGLYSPATDQLALSTNGTGRLSIDANGNVAVDTNTLYVDATNNRVGIGTSSVGAPLHVYGAATAASKSSQTGVFTVHSASTVQLNIGSENASPYGVWMQTRDASGTASNYPLVLNPLGGNVGIGTTSPAHDIDLRKDAAGSTVTLRVRNDNVAADSNSALVLDTPNGVWGLRALRSGGRLAVDIGGSEKAAIDANGRLLVGTSSTSLTSKLVVKARTDDATGNGSITLQRGSLPSAAEQTIGAVQFTDNNDNYGAVISAVSEGSWVSGSNHRSRLVFSTTADGASSPTPRMTIDRDGNITANSFDTAFTGAFYRFSASSGESPQVRIGGNADLSAGTTDVSIGLYRWDHAQYTQTRTNMYAYIEGRAIVEWAVQNYGTYLRFYTRTWNNGNTGPNEKMRLTHDGKLLIGYTGDNGNYKLQVNSQIFATSSTIATSDGRYKEDIATLDGCVDLVKALRPVSFTWKPQEDIVYTDSEGNEEIARKAHNFPEGVQVGFIAQEVQDVLVDKPWLGSIIKENSRPAVTDGEGNELAPEEEFLGIAEGNLVAVLTSALKDAIGRIEILEAEVAALKAQ